MSATEGVGLDPAVGLLLRDGPEWPSLALDPIEELRPVFADRLALSLSIAANSAPAISRPEMAVPCF